MNILNDFDNLPKISLNIIAEFALFSLFSFFVAFLIYFRKKLVPFKIYLPFFF